MVKDLEANAAIVPRRRDLRVLVTDFDAAQGPHDAKAQVSVGDALAELSLCTNHVW